MKKKGQAAIEFLLVVALMLLVFVPTTFIFMKNTQKTNDKLAISKIDRLARLIINTAEIVYYEGPPSKRTIRGDFPSGISNINILSEWDGPIIVNQLIINYTASDPDKEMVYDSKVNINGTFNLSDFSKGIKNIVLTSNRTSNGKSFVYINIK